MSKKQIGEILVNKGVVTPEDLEEALKQQKRQLGQILVDMGKVKPEDIQEALDLQSLPVPLAQRYLRYLRISLFILAVAVVGGSTLLVQRVRALKLRAALDAAQLPPARVMHFLQNGSAGERLDALRSVSRLRQDEKTTLLRQALEDANWTVRLVACMSIRAEALKSLIPELIPHLMDSDRTVRQETLRLLQELSGAAPGENFQSWFHWAKSQGLKVREPKDFTSEPAYSG